MSTRRDLILIGGGEHARSVGAAALAGDAWALIGLHDPRPCPETAAMLGIVQLDDAAFCAAAGARLVLGVGAIGDSSVRRRIVAAQMGRPWGTVVHPRAWVAPSAVLGEGTVVLAGAVVNAGAKVGAHCVINSGAIIEHDVVMGGFAQAAPGAVIGGGAVIGADAFVGLGASVRDHVTIGAGGFVAMGEVLHKDLPPGAKLLAGRVVGGTKPQL